MIPPSNFGDTSNKNQHTTVVRQVLHRLGARDDCRVWLNNTGFIKPIDGSAPIRFGLVGSCDVIGFTSLGQFIGFEIKTGAARLTRNQKTFHHIAKSFGAIIFTVHSADEAEACINSLNLPTCRIVLPI